MSVVQVQHPLAVITPTVDGDVLTVLAGAEHWFTTGQLHQLIPDRSIQGIRLAVTRLASQGIVDHERVGQTGRYSLNRDHLAAQAVVALADQRNELFRRIETELRRWPDPPTYAAIFGSAARGTMRPDSDIDIFLVRPNGAEELTWERCIEGLSGMVTKWTGNDTRPLVMSVDEVRRKARAEPVMDDIARDGITVCGRAGWLRTQLRQAG